MVRDPIVQAPKDPHATLSAHPDAYKRKISVLSPETCFETNCYNFQATYVTLLSLGLGLCGLGLIAYGSYMVQAAKTSLSQAVLYIGIIIACIGGVTLIRSVFNSWLPYICIALFTILALGQLSVALMFTIKPDYFSDKAKAWDNIPADTKRDSFGVFITNNLAILRLLSYICFVLQVLGIGAMIYVQRHTKNRAIFVKQDVIVDPTIEIV